MWAGTWLCIGLVQLLGTCRSHQIQVGQPNKASCEAKCPNDFRPLCGTDGVTYMNCCFFNCRRQDTKVIKKPWKAHDGVCTDKDRLGQPDVSVGQPNKASCEAKCPNDFRPLCGTDGVTYMNDCFFNCRRQDTKVIKKPWKAHDGVCTDKDRLGQPDLSVGQPNKTSCEDKCPSAFWPLCGTDGVTYMNDCFFNCRRQDYKVNKKLWKAHDGICFEKHHSREHQQSGGDKAGDVLCFCPVDFRPICATNGQTYQNPCYYECARERSYVRIWKSHDGICLHNEKGSSNHLEFDLCGCSLKNEPVCASNNRTYRNACFLQCERLLHDHSLTMEYSGECRADSVLEKLEPSSPEAKSTDLCNCPSYSFPVCGSDGKTYQNDCYLQCARFFTDHTLWKVLDSECVSEAGSTTLDTDPMSQDQCNCGALVAPVCGSDNHTYRSECVLECVRIFYSDLRKIYDGECKQEISLSDEEEKKANPCTLDCLDIYHPICGFDGKRYITFQNYCHLHCRQLEVPDLEYVHPGVCESPVPNSATQKVGKEIEEVCNCTKEYPRFSPRCGFDGKNHWLYNNKCLLQCAMKFFPKLRPASLEDCWDDALKNIGKNNLQADPEECKCTQELSPACAFNESGYYLYKNKCFLRCAQTIFPRLKPIKMEDCKYISKIEDSGHNLPDDFTCFCSKMYQPICGTDGEKYITYQNLCVFKCLKLKYPKLQVAHNGECRRRTGDPAEQEERDCPVSEMLPVCGYDAEDSQFKSFKSYCAFKREMKTHRKLRYIHDGACIFGKEPLEDETHTGDLCICSKKENPVCGSNGTNYITFINYCSFQCYQLKYPRLRLVHQGACISQLEHFPKRPAPRKVCNCPDTFHQVCGTDGLTYKNKCFLECKKIYNSYDLRLDHEGRCMIHRGSDSVKDIIEYEPPIVLGCACPWEVVPVCGSDGKTYRNMCSFECEKSHYNPILWLVYVGKCRGNNPKSELHREQARYYCNCTTYYQPLCGSDGTTYLNDCYFRCQSYLDHGLWKLHDGECFFTNTQTNLLLPKPEAHYICQCINDFQPVCGSDFRTYINDCYLKCITSFNKGLSKLHDGDCLSFFNPKFTTQIETNEHRREALSCWCSPDYVPVCASNMKTYINDCVLKCVKLEFPEITKLHDGECTLIQKDFSSSELIRGTRSLEWKLWKTIWEKACNCPKEYKPVCGSDGETYNNICSLQCRQKFCGGDVIWKNHDGECKTDASREMVSTTSSPALSPDSVPVDPSCSCPLICRPVCGSDGLTYVNECQMECTNRKNHRDVKKFHDGYCLTHT